MINQLESIIGRLVRDLNRTEDNLGNSMVVRRTKIQNIVDELSEIADQLETPKEDPTDPRD